jgi:hypothetical protein
MNTDKNSVLMFHTMTGLPAMIVLEGIYKENIKSLESVNEV